MRRGPCVSFKIFHQVHRYGWRHETVSEEDRLTVMRVGAQLAHDGVLTVLKGFLQRGRALRTISQLELDRRLDLADPSDSVSRQYPAPWTLQIAPVQA